MKDSVGMCDFLVTKHAAEQYKKKSVRKSSGKLAKLIDVTFELSTPDYRSVLRSLSSHNDINNLKHVESKNKSPTYEQSLMLATV